MKKLQSAKETAMSLERFFGACASSREWKSRGKRYHYRVSGRKSRNWKLNTLLWMTVFIRKEFLSLRHVVIEAPSPSGLFARPFRCRWPR